MSNKYKPWQQVDRRPKKFRKATAGQMDFDPNDRRNVREKRQDKNNRWRQNWDSEL